jgi:hypothetical protein
VEVLAIMVGKKFLVAGLSAALISVVGVPAVVAAPSDVVISELMYNPPDAAPVEFLEVVNRGPASQDISNWCVATGIDFCFPVGTTLDPDEYIVVTDDLGGFAAAYGPAVLPLGQYAGGLSNGGETIDLVDAAGTLIDTVTYDDAAPWPAAADGTGPSLELVDLDADNADAANWLASIAPVGHTVGAVNSVDGVVFPTIENVVASPFRPSPGESIIISAGLSEIDTATLSYVIGWGAEQQLVMDDGPSSVGGAGDGVWSAVIPGQLAGDLVRYRLDVVRAGVVAGVPDPTDTIDYRGVVVDDPAVSSSLPLLEWFMDDAVHDDLLANHRFDDVTGDAVVAYDGVVIDNVEMYIRGNSSRVENKVSWKVEFPKGYLFDMGGLLDSPVDEFNMQRSNYVHEELGWGTAEAAGLLSLQYFKIRTQRNGEFYSVATLGGVYDGRWRDENGRSDWALYKAEKQRGRARSSEQALIDSLDWDKKEGDDDDWSDLHELTTMLDAPPTVSQRDWMWEHLNVPQMINYAAVISVLRHSDSSWYNYYVTNDTTGTGRWEMMLWDMDTMFRTDAVDTDGDFVTPADNGQKFMIALMNHPGFEQMYFRRVRTLIDAQLQPSDYEDFAASIFDPYRADFELDRAMWGGRTASRHQQVLFGGIEARRDDVASNSGIDGSGLFPPAASGQTPIEIVQVEHASAAGQAAEFLRIQNTSANESVDLSGWFVGGGVSATIAPGTVLIPGATAYLVADDNTFRAVHGAANFVSSTYSGSLSDAGGQLELRTAGGALVDSVDFPLDDEESDVQFIGLGRSWRFFDAGAAPVGWTGSGFDDAGWASGPAELGFGDGDEVTVVSSAQKTSYFRKTFTVDDPADVRALTATLRADDGAVVYLNGVEVARDNMPEGPIGHNTSAARTRYIGENDLRDFSLSTASLVAGENVVAVEVHNRSITSSDLSFDMALVGRVRGGGVGGNPPGEVVALGSAWRYFDSGAAPAGWTTAGFDAVAWSAGSAELGFGDGDESTVVNSSQKTVYFRTTFTIADPGVVALLVATLRADDGAVIFVNGVEVARDNMPTGPIGHNTNASSTRYVDEDALRDFSLPVGVLIAGENVMAVEVHNRSLSSSDLSFDLRLRAD